MISQADIDRITESVEAFNDLARNEIVKCAYHFKQIEKCIDRLNIMVGVLHGDNSMQMRMEEADERLFKGGGVGDSLQGDEERSR